MDSRFVHTADALRDAVLDLAARRPIEQVTAAEVAMRAGVTRRTFYNHWSSPVDLLVSILHAELVTIADDCFDEICRGVPLGEAWRRGDDALANHLVQRAAIYAAGMSPECHHMSSSLSHMIVDEFELGVLRVFEHSGGAREDPRITARFIGHGIVGAIEAWLLTPELDAARLAAGIVRSVPGWVSGMQE